MIQTSRAGVPADRIAALATGINLSHWYAQAQGSGYADEHLLGYMQASDFALIKRMGFRHVRFTFEPALLWDYREGDPAVLDPEGRQRLDRAMKSLLDHGLVVVLDMHPSDDGFKRATVDKASGGDVRFARFWESLAAHMRRYDPDRVLLEVLNEPVVEDLDAWLEAQGLALAAMRRAAPNHTLIATSHRWSGVEDFVQMTPYDDPNIVYTFHCYEPFLFTHQGATWGWELTRHVRNLPYPSSPEAVAPVLPTIENAEARAVAKAYGDARWDAARVEAHIRQAVEWGKRHRRPIYCGEFGVFRPYSPPADRAACLRDLRVALEKHGVGWAMWDYAGGFAVATGERGARQGDPVTLRALGLAP